LRTDADGVRGQLTGPCLSGDRWAATLVALELDHVLLAVADLAAAAEGIEARHGLVSIEGGRHPGWGTANRIVPLGEAYLELVAVVDEAEAAQSAFGRWVAAAHPSLPRLLGWAVRTHELDDFARRLDLTVAAGSRASGSGQLVRWRLAGIEQATAEPSLPFFIEWGHGTQPPGRAPATHRAGVVQIATLRLDGDADRLAAWLGAHRLPITMRPGTPAVASIVLTGAAGEFVLDTDRM
jgi:Glyoxalase-like domain